MEKPISIQIQEATQSIITAVNDSKLPPCLLLPIIKNIYESVINLAQKEYEQDKQQYQQNSNEEVEAIKE